MSSDDGHMLDNVVWTALTTAHAGLAQGDGPARLYPRDMTPFAAVVEPSAAAYAELAHLLPAGLEARLFRPREEPTPEGWETLSVRPILQMVATSSGVGSDEAVDTVPVLLGPGDVAEMLALADVTKPGPLGARSVLLGDFVGWREPADGRLVAMAGERFQLPGYAEVSGVAVHPRARGRGLAALLMRDLMRRAAARDETSFLHVFPDNPAVRLYRRLGFRERARPVVVCCRPADRTRSATP